MADKLMYIPNDDDTQNSLFCIFRHIFTVAFPLFLVPRVQFTDNFQKLRSYVDTSILSRDFGPWF